MHDLIIPSRGAVTGNVLVFVPQPALRACLPRRPAPIVPLRRARAGKRDRWRSAAWWSLILAAMLVYLGMLLWRVPRVLAPLTPLTWL